MSVNKVNSDGSLSRVAGGTLYADSPIGAISPFGGSTVPSGYLLCNGAEVLKTAYAELYAVIGDAFGTASDNTKFKLPDLREATTKGVGLNGRSAVHYDADGVALGEFIEDRVQTHTHIYTGVHQSSTAYIYISGGSGMDTDDTGAGITGNNTGRSGATTEVKAVGVNYIIKAKQVAVPTDLANGVEEYINENAKSPISASNKLVTESDISYLSRDKLMYHQETGAAVLYLAAYHWQLPINDTYIVHVTACDKNSITDNYDGIVKFTYGGTSSTITSITHTKLSGTGSIDAENNSGTLQFSFSNGLPEVCVELLG